MAIIDTLKRLQALEEGWYSHYLLYTDSTEDLTDSELAYNKHIRSDWSTTDPRASEIFEWCNNNCKGGWVQSSGNFYFKEERDMKWFVLRWG
jgi:hypothetical protein